MYIGWDYCGELFCVLILNPTDSDTNFFYTKGKPISYAFTLLSAIARRMVYERVQEVFASHFCFFS